MIPASLFALIGSRCLAGCPRGRFPDSTDGFYARLPGGYLCRGVLPRLRLGPFLRGCSAPGPVRLPGGSRPPYPQQPWSGRRGEVPQSAQSARRPACLWQDGRVVVPSGQGNGGRRSRASGGNANCGLCAGVHTNDKRNSGGIGKLGQSRAQHPNYVRTEIVYKSGLSRRLRRGEWEIN